MSGEERTSPGRAWGPAAAGLALVAVWLMGGGEIPTGHFRPPAAGSGADSRPAAVYPAHRALLPSRPVRVDIPSAGIHAEVVERGLDSTGAVDPPPYRTPEVAGWYGGGPTPGEAGAAVLVGHVDTPTRPAVFHGLSTVTQGTRIDIARADGSVARFTVEAVEVVEKDDFSADRVYGQGVRPELRLITCGGVFDRATRTYSANVVVHAALTGVRHA